MSNKNLTVSIWDHRSETIDQIDKLLPYQNIDSIYNKYIVLKNESKVIAVLAFKHYNDDVIMFTPIEFKKSFPGNSCSSSFVQVTNLVIDGTYFELGLEYMLFNRLMEYLTEHKIEFCSCLALEQILFMLRHSPYRMDPIILADGSSYLVFHRNDVAQTEKYLKLQAIAAKANYLLHDKENIKEYSESINIEEISPVEALRQQSNLWPSKEF